MAEMTYSGVIAAYKAIGNRHRFDEIKFREVLKVCIKHQNTVHMPIIQAAHEGTCNYVRRRLK